MGDQKNLILAAVLSFLVIGLWEVFVIGPQREEIRIAAEVEAAKQAANPADEASAPGGIVESAKQVIVSRDEALAQNDRVIIDSPSVDGSISLLGGRLDDLNLKDYRVSIEDGSPEVTLLSPTGTETPYYSVFGWAGANAGKLPGLKTPWELAEGDVLSVNAPVTLEWTNEKGITFRKTYEIDKDYLFTITQEVTNSLDDALTVRPYGIIARHGEPETLGMYLLHEGSIGAYDGITEELDYDEFADAPYDRAENANLKKVDVTENGYIGFTDKYWMTALIPEPGTSFTAAYKVGNRNEAIYQTDVRLNSITIPAGESASAKVHFFAGAKRAELLSAYEEQLGVDRLYDAIDWGWFYFLTKPFFWLLSTINKIVGNFGVAIILLTVLVKAVMFPLAYKSYVSMGRMKKLQPQTEKIREKHKEDPQAMQRAMMDLYKKEKVNPAAGCLPILLQIPVFFSLYKVLFVTIEMRHAPFFGWIQDLSAPDPTSIFTGFGAFDWGPPAFLLIGIWPIIMGITMWLQMQLNPAPPDPIQKKIFAWMPVLFTFLLGSFPAGLVIYWTANNVLTIVQQASIMKSQGAKIELLDNLKDMFSRKKAE